MRGQFWPPTPSYEEITIMHNNRNRQPKPNKDHKGRVLARELSEELAKVQGGMPSGTFTQAPPDIDFDRD
ncbi:MAG: hypothetical protein Tsb0020_53530 [Haliangiales bacterium]